MYTDWMKINNKFFTVCYRVSGDRVQINVLQKQETVKFDLVKFLNYKGLFMNMAALSPNTKLGYSCSEYEYDQRQKRPLFKNFLQKAFFVLTNKPLYEYRIVRRKKIFQWNNRPAKRLNPKFLLKQSQIFVPIYEGFSMDSTGGRK